MTLGFTGTQQGMAPRQLKVVRQLLYNCVFVHLGDCVGADAQAHAIATEYGVTRIGHPPTERRKRAFLDYDEERGPKPYLMRNLDIAMEGVDGLVAAPSGWIEEQRSGTWSTVRRARKLRRHIWIVRPDGSVVEER